MSSSKIHTMTFSAPEEVAITPPTSITSLDKPTWEGKPALELPNPTQEDFNDIGDYWSKNAWPTEENLKKPFNSALPSSDSWSTPENSWGTGPPVEIPAYHTHFTVLDSMDQRSGYTHYLVESYQAMLFHGHQLTSKWTQQCRHSSKELTLSLLPELLPIRVDFLFPAYHPSMTRFRGTTHDPHVFMKKQPFLKRTAFKTAHHASCTSQEILRCEQISKHPHPNLARYPGVETEHIATEERVTRLAYKRYDMDLYTFVLVKRQSRPHHVPVLLRGVESGMKHLHRLGLVHCHLRPMNVFVTVAVEEGEDAQADVGLRKVVIGDFAASVQIGQEVALKRASGEWWPDDVEWGIKTEPWIVEWCLKKLEKWLVKDGLGIWDFGVPTVPTSEGNVRHVAVEDWMVVGVDRYTSRSKLMHKSDP